MASSKFNKTNAILAAVVIIILVVLFWPMKQTRPVTKASALTTTAEEKPACPAPLAKRYKAIAAAINADRLKADVFEFSSYPSRLVGYPGCEKASEYVERRFREIGLEDVKSEPFRVTVPIDEGSRIVVDGQSFPIYALWPNLVRTSHLPPEGLKVHVIDAGSGRLPDFDGKVVKGSAALVDFNSGTEWLNAPRLGARALLFVEPDKTMRGEGEAKFSAIPVSMPRFWISKENAAKIRALIAHGRANNARIYCTMPWEKVRARNIIGVIRGTDPELRDEWIVLHAYYDGTSVVPALAPSAESSCGIAALLELARLFKQPQFAPKRSVMFLATSGHFQGLAGMRAFVERHIDSYRLPGTLDRIHQYLNTHWPVDGPKALPWPPIILAILLLLVVRWIWTKIRFLRSQVPAIVSIPVVLAGLVIWYCYGLTVSFVKGFNYEIPNPPEFYVWAGLDLSSQTQGVGIFYKGYFYDYREDLQGKFSDLASRARENSERVAAALGFFETKTSRFADGVNPITGKNWRNFVPGKFALDSEVITLAGGIGVSFVSIDDGRPLVDTPFDKPEYVNFGNLHKQLEMIACLVDHWFRDTRTAMDEEILQARVVDRSTIRVDDPLRIGYVQGVFTDRFARGKSYYRPKSEKDVPNVLPNGSIKLTDELPEGVRTVYIRQKPLTKLGVTEQCKFTRMGLQGGFARLSGNVVQYDPRRSFVPNLKVGDCLAVVRSAHKSFMGVRANIIDKTTPHEGYFSIPGVAPLTAYGWQRLTSIGAYKLDAVRGDIICAPDQGSYGQFYPTSFTITTGYKDMPIIVFDCKATSIYDLVDPQSLRALVGLSMYEGDTDGAPRQFGFAVAVPEPQNPHVEDMAVLFTEDTKKTQALATGTTAELKRIRIKVVMSAGPAANRLLLLNSTLGDEVIPADVVRVQGRVINDRAVPVDSSWQVKVEGAYLNRKCTSKNYYFLGPGEVDNSVTRGVIGLSGELLSELPQGQETIYIKTNHETIFPARIIKVITLDKPWYESVLGVYTDSGARGKNYLRPAPNERTATSLKTSQVCVSNDFPTRDEIYLKVRNIFDGTVRVIEAGVDAIDLKAVVLGENLLQVRAVGVYENADLTGRNYYEPKSSSDGIRALVEGGPVLTERFPSRGESRIVWIKTNQPKPIKANLVRSLMVDKPIEVFVSGVYMDPDCTGRNYLVTKFGTSYNNASLLRGELQLTEELPENAERVYIKPFAQPEGIGYDVTDGGTIDETAYKVAIDMWKLDEYRLRALASKGVVNEGLNALHSTAKSYLDLAEKAKGSLNYSVFDSYCRAAWGYEARAYPDVTSTAQDVVNGVIFYLFLMLPFAYFAERLFFAFPTLGRQLLAFFGIFLGVFILFYFVHPAFQIVGQASLVILIAFVMLALSLLVISIVTGKFEDQLKQFNRSVSGIHKADIGRMSVAAAAFSLGISNMRRRKARTVLTCVTLILLTFTVLSFTSIVSVLRFNKVPAKRDPDTHVYDGIMIRTAMWDPLQEIAYRHLKDEFGNKGRRGRVYPVAPRAWFYGTVLGEQSFLTLRRGENSYDAKAAVGMVPDEAEITDFETRNRKIFVAGDWFGYKNGKRVSDRVDPYSMIIPDTIAEKLGITPADVGKAKVEFAGAKYTVVAIIKNEVFKRIKDLDNEPLTPVDFILMSKQGQQQAGAEAGFREYTHHEPANTFIVPFETLMGLGGDLRSIAIKFATFEEVQRQLDALMPRLGLNLYAGIGGYIYRYSSIAASSSKGFSNVFIPVLIAALIVLNTMLGSVYERVREIGIFSAIGLAPSHIAILFIAESMVYANLGAVAGYVIGQGVSKLLMATNWLPGLYLNFSSMSAVTSTLVVVAVVLLSTLYPARKASEVATPAVDRTWKVPEPVGDAWNILLPFAVTGEQALGVNVFLREWFQAYEEYSIGDFVTQDVQTTILDTEYGKGYQISCKAWLAPFDLGVSQTVILQTVPTSMEDVFEVKVQIIRESGDISNWKRVNRRFLNTLRKQFLIWRTLRPSDRERYLKQAHAEETGEAAPAPV
ncbi:MAG: FtsX-like permease family protein [Armatimonadota bacterium]